MMKSFQLIAASAALLFSTPTLAATVIGGNTAVSVTADLTALGLTISPSGTGTVDSLIPNLTRIFFPITGGALDAALAGQILHEGSGVILSAGSTSITLDNFIIDTTLGQILGDVAVNGASIAADAAIFTFDLTSVSVDQLGNLSNPTLKLFITPTAATVLGNSSLAGAQFGVAATAPRLSAVAVVPETTTWAMLIVGFGMTGFVLRRRRAVVQHA